MSYYSLIILIAGQNLHQFFIEGNLTLNSFLYPKINICDSVIIQLVNLYSHIIILFLIYSRCCAKLKKEHWNKIAQFNTKLVNVLKDKKSVTFGCFPLERNLSVNV